MGDWPGAIPNEGIFPQVLPAGPLGTLLVAILVVTRSPVGARPALGRESPGSSRMPPAPAGRSERRSLEQGSGQGAQPDEPELLPQGAPATRTLPRAGTGTTRGGVTRVSLSLDVPVHVLRVLLELARDSELRARAAANTELMARVGRRR
uniref:Corticotropin-releasing factor domain-containing protein n=1 Tax=Nothoprocta perdicaria TaxID=30464 RepID=A0A8C7EBF2_NOTPE